MTSFVKSKTKTVIIREKNLLYKGKETWMETNPLNYLKTKNDFIKYNGNWKIENNKLYLLSLKADYNRFPVVGIGYLFPGQEIVFAEWFTGLIKIPLGDILIYKYPIEDSIYERDLLLKFESGLLIEEYKRVNRKYLKKIEKERQKNLKLKRKEKERLSKALIKYNRKFFWKKLFGLR